MMDFCYFVNFSVVLQTAFFPDNLLWFKANYVLCMGPICIAIMVWKNSLVFHSLDKLTSFFLHAFPTMVSILIFKGEFSAGYTRLIYCPQNFCHPYFWICRRRYFLPRTDFLPWELLSVKSWNLKKLSPLAYNF